MELNWKTIILIALILPNIIILLYVYKVLNTKTEYRNYQSNISSSPTVRKINAPFLPLNYSILNALTMSQLNDLYWRYINSLQVLCRNQTRLGSMKDGGKEVCIDDLYKPRQPCLVYSFGSNFKFDFEMDVLRFYKCEVHTFDPSKQIGHRKIPGGVNFHLVGLGSRDTTNKKGWKMKTLLSIRRELNHTNRVLDLLKIDIEGGEWSAFLEMFHSGVLEDVKQICVELHPEPNVARQLDILRQLYEQGFYMFMHEHNLFSVHHSKVLNRDITVVNEISLINVNWKEVRN